MVTNNKVLTVSYGTFSCTLEGFEDNFDTMKAIAEYFRDLAADDRYFGAEPPTPDAEMLARIAEREIERRVQARTDQGTLVLTAGSALDERQEEADPAHEAPAVQEIPEGEETAAIDDDQLAEERNAFFAEVDSVAHDHVETVAEDVAAHEVEAEAEAEAEVDAVAEVEVEAEVEAEEVAVADPVSDDSDAEPLEVEEAPRAETTVEEDVAEDIADIEDAPVEVAPLVLEASAEVSEDVSDAADVADDYEDDADNFFSGTKAQTDEGVSSIAAKLSRIRAVVSKAEEDDEADSYTEDEHADNPAADFLRKSASDIEGSLEDEDDHEAAPEPAPQAARVIRMRRSEKRVEDAAEPVAKAPAPEPEDALEEVVGEDTMAEFENGYAETALDEETYDEEVQEDAAPAPEPLRRARPRVLLSEDAPQEDSVDRLLDEANTKLEDPDTSRRRTTLAHLRRAVAATRAEKSAGTYEGNKDQSGAYREDLADVMRPRGAAQAAPVEAHEDEGAAPLRLVASQRVDADETPEETVRPRRVSPADIASFEPKEQSSDFVAFAEEVGASDLPDILEAAASYLTYVEGRRRFSRPMLMRLAYQLGPDRFQREAGLRSFGQLLREKKIEKIAGGRFTAAESIRFKPEQEAG